NGVFECLIRPRDGVQPPYIPINAASHRTSAGLPNIAPLPKVMVRKIVAGDDDITAEKARRIEGASLARWLKDEIIEKAAIINSSGEQVSVQPKDIAILFRKL